MKFDKRFEEEILAQSLKSVKYLKSATRILDAHHFNTPQHAWCWRVIRGTWNKYKERTTARLFLTRARKDFKKDEERFMYLDLVRRLYKKKVKAPKATLEELSNFVRTVNAQLALESAAEHLEKGKIDSAYEEMSRVTRKDLKVNNYTLVKWIEEFDLRQDERKYRKEHPKEFKRIPTGFKRLDAIMGGHEVGELGLILATTNQGKSIFLNNLAYAATLRGFKTVYYALEMPARQVAMRQDSRWLGIPYIKFKEYNFKPSELRKIKDKLKKFRKKWNNKLRIISMPHGTCDLNSIRNSLDDLYEDDGFRPDQVLIDSGDHMASLQQFSPGQIRLEHTSIYGGLKEFAETDGYSVWSSVHAGREFADKIATAEATAEAYNKARIADTVISLNTPKKSSRASRIILDEDDDDEGLPQDFSQLAKNRYVELFLAKYRDGLSRVTIPLDADFSRMYFSELEYDR